MRAKIISWLRWWFGLAKTELTVDAKTYSIAVIIPAYNEAASIAKTIASVQAQTVKISEIIVVDDCSSDQTGAISRQCGATVVRTPVNQGTKAMAQNFALGEVTSELLVTIDADTTLHPEAIARTLSYFNDELTASVCGFVIPQKIETIWEKGRYIEYLFGISLFKAAQNHVGVVMVSSGCFSVFRTAILRKLGGFKKRTMAEDMDFTWEATLAGYHIYCAPEAICYPLDPPTGKIFVNQIKRWYASFFQNISLYKFEFRKKIRLGCLVYGSLLDAIFSPLVMVVYFFSLTHNIWQALLWGLVIDFALVLFFCLGKSLRLGLLKETLLALPGYFLIRPVNLCLFWYCLWNEWIVGNRLSSWDKGH